MYLELKTRVCQANLELKKQGLIILSWGNVSEIDRKAGVVAIKPSGISYDELTPEEIVVLDLEGSRIEGNLKPSSDTATHLKLYKNFPEIGGICHTHSPYATMWAQAKKEIPCFGTTHADNFYGTVPITREMTKTDIETEYELNTGKVIVERYKELDPMQNPAVLVSCHGPFSWGKSAIDSVTNALVLEEVAKIAFGTLSINPEITEISKTLLDKHFLRKHGKNAYYGQKK
jgi:L-ribulose-5-phosphate 4-epimerase